MTAGFGIQHEEMPNLAPGDPYAHATQLWINLPSASKLMPPRYQDLTRAAVPHFTPREGVDVALYSGSVCGTTSPTLNVVPVLAALVRLAPGSEVSLAPIPLEHQGFLYVLEGAASIGPAGQPASLVGGQAAVLPPAGSGTAGESELALRSAGNAELVAMVFLGQPIAEPVVQRGPFVMCSVAE